VPEIVLDVLGAERRDALRGMVHAVRAATRMRTMAERTDLRASSFAFTDETTGQTRTALVCYDSHPGGIGFASKAFDFGEEILLDALEMVRDCPCQQGCPACVGDYTLSKRAIAWSLERCMADVPPPADLAALRPIRLGGNAHTPSLERRFDFEDLANRWQAIRAELYASGEFGTELLGHIEQVDVRADKLILRVHSPGLCRWLEQENNRQQLMNLIEAHVRMPKSWRLAAESTQDDAERAGLRQHKLRRRLEDLTREEVRDEREANDKLAAGFVVPGNSIVH
jgi:DEAD/DEAH box helicase domain-containing protein